MLTAKEVWILDRLLAEHERRDNSNSLASFLKAGWPTIEPKLPFIPGYHIDSICEHLEAVFNGEIRNLLINIPPRHAKSTIVSVAFPAWGWTKASHKKFLFGSHSFNLAKRDSVRCRNVITSRWYRETFNLKWELAEDQNEKRRYDTTDGGARICTSVLASIIGEGGDILVLDDPHSPRSVRSDVKRKDELEWIDTEFFTRVNDPKTVAKVVIMQRLDQRDASAHLLAQGDWEHLMLPAEFEIKRKCVTSIGWEDKRTKEGEPLWPERFGTPEIAKEKKSMGSKAWAGQGQQRPAPAEGNILKREWLCQFYKEIPQDLDLISISVDLPFDEGGTFAVFQVWGKKGGKRYLLDQTRADVGYTAQKVMFKSALAKWMAHGAWIEKKANGAAIINELRLEYPGLVPITPQGSKEVRAEAVAPQFEAGDVWLPDPSIAPWISDYIEELVAFPNALNDDQVDATTQALLKMKESQTYDWAPVSLTQTSKFLSENR